MLLVSLLQVVHAIPTYQAKSPALKATLVSGLSKHGQQVAATAAAAARAKELSGKVVQNYHRAHCPVTNPFAFLPFFSPLANSQHVRFHPLKSCKATLSEVCFCQPFFKKKEKEKKYQSDSVVIPSPSSLPIALQTFLSLFSFYLVSDPEVVFP